MTTQTVAAVDIGAESGRVVAVDFDGEKLSLEVTHRFRHEPSSARDGRLRWNWPLMSSEVVAGLRSLAARRAPRSVGVDTFGLDYGLLDSKNNLMESPVCYREPYRVEAFSRAVKTHGREFLYQNSGTQVVPFNGIFGFVADTELRPGFVETAGKLLMFPDLFHHMLSGVAVAEYTDATTSGFFDIRKGTWSGALANAIGIPADLLPEIAQPGTELGLLVPTLRANPGLGATRVILPPSHDTASALLAITEVQPHELFISSGTWSIVGVVMNSPIVSAASLAQNVTNEGGVNGTIRFIKNVMGLWMLQESRREWARQGQDYDYTTLMELARREPPLRSFVDPAHTNFLAPGDMPGRIRDYCRDHKMPVPESVGQVTRAIVDSLALAYRSTLDDIASVTGVGITAIRVVGGGVQNGLLQQATADATGVPVRLGPVEATALGNALGQLISLGTLSSLEQAWEVVDLTFPGATVLPVNSAPYEANYFRFRLLEQETKDELFGPESVV